MRLAPTNFSIIEAKRTSRCQSADSPAKTTHFAESLLFSPI